MTAPRFLVIGCGSIGRRHIGNLVRLAAGPVLAFDVREDRRREVRDRHGVEVYDRLEEAWERRPDVVLITAPTSLHVPLAREAARHGCHLFIEKPLADRREGVDELLREVRERGRVTLVGCNLRFHPGLRKVKTLLEDGMVGRVVAIRAEVGQYLPDWHPWEDYRQGYSARRRLGGGVILDAIHEIDYVRWLLGEVSTVACFSGQLSHLEIETEDTAALLLRGASGAVGEIHLDYVQRVYSRTCQVIGDEGTVRWDYSAGEVRCYTAQTREWQVFPNPPGWEPNDMYVDELRHFLACLSGDEQPALDAFAAARVLDVALAARTSADTGQVVRLEQWQDQP
jgi:predicted dehydrogenase